MALIKAKHIKLYKKYTEALIKDLSKDITLTFEGEGVFCGNCTYDHKNRCSTGQYNGTGPKRFVGMCPICKGKGKIFTETTKIIQGIAKWVVPGEKEKQNDEISAGITTIGYFRIKTLVANLEDIKSARKIIIDENITTLVNIIPRGLKENVVAIAYTTIDEG